jgi:hypothetical protein
MTAAFAIRAATASDYEGVVKVLAEVDELHRVRLPWSSPVRANSSSSY